MRQVTFLKICNQRKLFCSFSGVIEARKQYDHDYSEFMVDNYNFNRLSNIDSVLCGNKMNKQMRNGVILFQRPTVTVELEKEESEGRVFEQSFWEG